MIANNGAVLPRSGDTPRLRASHMALRRRHALGCPALRRAGSGLDPTKESRKCGIPKTRWPRGASPGPLKHGKSFHPSCPDCPATSSSGLAPGFLDLRKCLEVEMLGASRGAQRSSIDRAIEALLASFAGGLAGIHLGGERPTKAAAPRCCWRNQVLGAGCR